MSPWVKTKGKCNKSVNNKFKRMKESNSFRYQIMRARK